MRPRFTASSTTSWSRSRLIETLRSRLSRKFSMLLSSPVVAELLELRRLEALRDEARLDREDELRALLELRPEVLRDDPPRLELLFREEPFLLLPPVAAMSISFGSVPDRSTISSCSA
jgi:hypothetical protein